MTASSERADDTATLSFEGFWTWLVDHPNCILRAGTPDSVVYDDDDFHWSLASDGSEMVVAQVILGKRLIAQIVLHPEQIAYVQGFQGDHEGEYLFELIVETETERAAAYFFVLAHGYDDGAEDAASGRAVH